MQPNGQLSCGTTGGGNEPGIMPEHSSTTAGAKLAVTAASTRNVRAQVVPVQAPEKPMKRIPAAGLGVKMTVAPSSKTATQAPGQAIPSGAETTAPIPTVPTDRLWRMG